MIEVACFPRVSEREELLLRLLGEGAGATGVEIVEQSEGRISAGTIYDTLRRLTGEALLRREGRTYRLTPAGKAVLRAMNAAAKAYREAMER